MRALAQELAAIAYRLFPVIRILTRSDEHHLSRLAYCRGMPGTAWHDNKRPRFGQAYRLVAAMGGENHVGLARNENHKFVTMRMDFPGRPVLLEEI